MNGRLLTLLKYSLLLLPLLFLAVFYFYPLAAIFGLSFAPDGRFQPDNLSQLLTRPLFRQTLWFTVWQAAVSTLLTLLLACRAPTSLPATVSRQEQP
jgi:thiamine transport system permease protein